MRIDHVAHPSRDPRETHRFYNGVLNLKLVQAYAGRALMLVYALPGGGSLVFTASRGGEPLPANIPWEHRHVGLAVSTRAEFDSWLQRLQAFGVRHHLVDDERIYFSDPDGLVLELEVASETTINPAAHDILAQWHGH